MGLRGSWAYFMGKANAFDLVFMSLAETDVCSSILLEHMSVLSAGRLSNNYDIPF